MVYSSEWKSLILYCNKIVFINFMTLLPNLHLPNYESITWNICEEWGMRKENVYSPGHLVPYLFWTCICSNCRDKIFTKPAVMPLGTFSISLFLILINIRLCFRRYLYSYSIDLEKSKDLTDIIHSVRQPFKMLLHMSWFGRTVFNSNH